MPIMVMTWEGFDQPGVGQFMKSPRGRTAYEICSMREVQMREPRRGIKRYRMHCQRWQPSEVPDGATVWEIYWNKRKRRRR